MPASAPVAEPLQVGFAPRPLLAHLDPQRQEHGTAHQRLDRDPRAAPDRLELAAPLADHDRLLALPLDVDHRADHGLVAGRGRLLPFVDLHVDAVGQLGAELVDAGAEPHLIADRLYETWPRRQFELLVMVLNTLEIKNNVAITYVTEEMFRKTGTKSGDTENFSNFPRMIDTVKISAFMRDTGNGAWKISLRSKGDVNVARIAEFLGGGGHKNAAGFRLEADLETARAALLKAARRLT